jgi:hypothetical protein
MTRTRSANSRASRAQPSGQHQLLLVAARQRPGPPLQGRADAQLVGEAPGQLPLLAGCQQHAPAEPRQRGQGDVLGQGHARNDAGGAVLAEVADPERDRVGRCPHADRPAGHLHGAAGGRLQAEQGPGQAGPAGADQPEHGDHLTGPQLQVHRLEPRRPGQAAGPQGSRGAVAGRRRRRCRGAAAEGASDHHLGQPGLVDLGGPDRPDELAVAKHADPVGDVQHLGEPVGDVDHRHPRGGEVAHDAEQAAGLRVRQGGGGLVEQQDADVAGERLGDLHQLPLGHAELVDPPARVHVQADAAEVAPGGGVQLLPGHGPPACRRPSAEQHVLTHRELGHETQVLVDEGDPARPGRLQRPEGHGAAADGHLPGVGGDGAGDHLHQSRLAGAVLAEQGVDLAALHAKVNALERPHARVALAGALELEHGHG